MEELKVKTPAKINIGLHVISKRDDDYHNIETIFYPINLFDTISFKRSNKFKFTSDNEEISSSTDNLIIKAKELLEEETKSEFTIHIHLKKNIPIGGGLGGGSSNAAFTLSSLIKFFSLRIDDNRLNKLALRLGSDVPFFLNPKPCYAYSRGEKFEYREFKINYPVLIVNPGIHISTKWAYENIIPQTPKFDLKELKQEHLDAPKKLFTLIKNDFEEIVFTEYPVIKKLKDELTYRGALFSLMSGSGSTLFSIFPDIKSAAETVKLLPGKFFTYLEPA